MQELQPAQVAAARRQPQRQEEEDHHLYLQHPHQKAGCEGESSSEKKIGNKTLRRRSRSRSRRSQDEDRDEDFSQCDFKTRMRLLQSKLHPNSTTATATATTNEVRDEAGSICSSQDELHDSEDDDHSCCSEINDEDSLSMSSSTSSASSAAANSLCSPAPTPPPRHSSLLNSKINPSHQRPEVPQQQQQQHQQQVACKTHAENQMQIQLSQSPISDNNPAAATKSMQLDTHAIQLRQPTVLCHNNNSTPLPEPQALTAAGCAGRSGSANNGGNGRPAHHANQSPPPPQSPSIAAIRQPKLAGNLLPLPPLIQRTSISHNQQPMLSNSNSNNIQPDRGEISIAAGRQQNLSSVNYLPQAQAQLAPAPISAKTCYTTNRQSPNSAGLSSVAGLKFGQPAVNQQQQPLRVPFSSMLDLQQQLPDFDNLLHSSQPITKAVRNMVSKQQQQQQQTVSYVINTPSSRHPIRGCPLPPIPPNKPPNLMQRSYQTSSSSSASSLSPPELPLKSIQPMPLVPSAAHRGPQAQARPRRFQQQQQNQLGSHPSISMSSISSQASTATSTSSSINSTTVQQQQQSSNHSARNSSASTSSSPFQLNKRPPFGFSSNQQISTTSQQHLLALVATKHASSSPSSSLAASPSPPLPLPTTTHQGTKGITAIGHHQEQHIKDSKKGNSSRECLFAHEDQLDEDLDQEDPLLLLPVPASLDDDCCGCQCPKSATCAQVVETIVNQQGDHCVLVEQAGFSTGRGPAAAGSVELNGDLFALDEECGSLLSYQYNPPARTACCLRERQPIGQVEMRGWPMDELGDRDDLDEADDFVLLDRDALDAPRQPGVSSSAAATWWPIVGLHENPMNWLGDSAVDNEPPPSSSAAAAAAAVNQSESEGDLDEQQQQQQQRQQQEVRDLLERSRLLSLQASQLKNRAAIRMISSDSVQLLVSAEQSATSRVDEATATNLLANSTCSQEQQQQQSKSNNDTVEQQQVKLAEETTTSTTTGGTLVIVAPELAKRRSESPASAACATQAEKTKEGHEEVAVNCSSDSDPAGNAIISASAAQKNPQEFSKQHQHQQQQVSRRHVEQLMRLRQLAGSSSSTGQGSDATKAASARKREELPTLEQLQRQILLACESAESKASSSSSSRLDHPQQQQPQPEPLTLKPKQQQQQQQQQQRDSNDWPAFATTLAQQRQQQQQQNNSQLRNHCGNEASEQPLPVLQQRQVMPTAATAAAAATAASAPASASAMASTAKAAEAEAGALSMAAAEPKMSNSEMNEEEEEQQQLMAKHKSSWPILVVSKNHQEPSIANSSSTSTSNENNNHLPASDEETPSVRFSMTTADRAQDSSSSSVWPIEPSHTKASSIQDELSIMTSNSNSSNNISACSPQSRRRLAPADSSSGQSSPSVMGDSTLGLPESDMIPRLIERLDRKLVVMKEEQLTLMREIELNESTGQRLFESMRRRLAPGELDKITLHANEIEKVTKLILSLKLRLKRVEAELKERSKKEKQQQQQARLIDSPAPSSCNLSQSTASEEQQQQQQNNNNSSRQSCSSLAAGDSLDISAISASESMMMSSSRQLNGGGGSSSGKQTLNNPPVRGVSDPTSTVGLPKRNHQHHASLQLDNSSATKEASQQESERQQSGRISGSATNERRYAGDDETDDRYSSHSSSSSGCESRVGSPRVLLDANCPTIRGGNNAAAAAGVDNQVSSSAKSSSDSIFNSADSAIGSTITGHGGSISNIEDSHHHHHQPNRHHRHHHHQALQLSSAAGTEARLASCTSNSSMASSLSTRDDNNSIHSGSSSILLNSPLGLTRQSQRAAQEQLSSTMLVSPPSQQHTSAVSLSTTTGATILSGSEHTSTALDRETILQILSDVDILSAKRTKLVSQLEEAHQLEESILHRNNVIVQRILRKYFEENTPDGLIAEFRQFTRLKSLLLRDSHDIADRIDNAELQLNELKQTNQCSGP